MYIGIDLGGTNIAGGLVDENGSILKSMSLATKVERGSDAIINDIAYIVKELRGSNESIKSIGIGIPGIADPHTGDVIACVNLNWYHTPLRTKLEALTGLKVFIDNDATVAGVAEFQVSQKGKYKNAVMFTLGTGVGGGIIVGGEVVSGHHGISSELGHMIIGENSYDCNCGRNGCLETFASSTAIIRYAKELLKESKENSLMLELSGNNIDEIDGRVIFEAAKAGDKLANQVVNRLVKYLGRGIANVVCTLDPEIIVIGGGISHAGDFLLDKLRREMESLKYFKDCDLAKLEIAQLKNDAGIIGAAMYAKINQI